MYRIYFDGNEGDEDDRFDPGIPGSLADIEKLAGKLTQGMRVLYYEYGIEAEAILEWDAKYNQWMGRPLWETMKRLEVPQEAAE